MVKIKILKSKNYVWFITSEHTSQHEMNLKEGDILEGELSVNLCNGIKTLVWNKDGFEQTIELPKNSFEVIKSL